MIRGTTMAPAWPALMSRAAPVARYGMGDIEETRLLIEERRGARAFELMVAERQAARQEKIQGMALDAARVAQDKASEAQLQILFAGQVGAQQQTKSLTLVAVSGLVLFVLFKLGGRHYDAKATKKGAA